MDIIERRDGRYGIIARRKDVVGEGTVCHENDSIQVIESKNMEPSSVTLASHCVKPSVPKQFLFDDNRTSVHVCDAQYGQSGITKLEATRELSKQECCLYLRSFPSSPTPAMDQLSTLDFAMTKHRQKIVRRARFARERYLWARKRMRHRTRP